MNIENIRTNGKYLEEIAKIHDIILIQEHWLYEFEIKDLANYLPDFCYAGKATDTYDPILPIFKPRGKGGVAIFWRKDLERFIEVLDEGSERTLAIQINTSSQKYCIINSYMPSNDRDKYTDLLDEIHEIIAKYQETHSII